MKGRFVLMLAALLVGGALTGCIEAFENFQNGDKGITALQDRDLADGAAAAWNPAAFLIGAVTIETVDPRAGVPMDVEVGDGRAPLWYYAYGAPETNETRLFLVTADGRVTTEERLPGLLGSMDFDPRPLQGFTLDSDAAVAAARAHEVFGPVAAGANASILEAIAEHPEMAEPSWIVFAFSEAGLAMAMVDANTGEVTQVENLDVPDMPEMGEMPGMPMMPAFAFAPPLVIMDEGTLDESERERRYPFDAEAGMTGLLLLESHTTMPHEFVQIGVLGPDGALEVWYVENGEETFEFEFEETGEYEFYIALASYADVFGLLPPVGSADFWFELTVGHGVFDMPHMDD